MDTESLSTSKASSPVRANEIRASRNDENEFEAYGFSGLLPSPPKRSFPRWDEALFEDGYDSDGEILEPNVDEADDENELASSDHILAPTQGVLGGNTTMENTTTQTSTSSESSSINIVTASTAVTQSLTLTGAILADDLIDKMVVAELRTELKRRGMPVNGLMDVLKSRLKDAKHILPTIDGTQIDQDGVRSLKEFLPGTKWVQMPLTSQPVEETSRLIDGVQFRGPTDDENLTHTQPLYNVEGIIDRLPFPGMALLPKKDSNGRMVYGRRGEFIYELQPATETVVNIDFVK